MSVFKVARLFSVAECHILLYNRGLCNAQMNAQSIYSLRHHGIPKRYFSSFDVFKKLKDPPDGDETKSRKPSDKVLRLVDEIMNLTLIEAADLCDLCQEKLAERGGGPTFNAAAAAGRVPFPHPSAMFSGMISPGMPPMMGMPNMANINPSAAATPAPESEAQPAKKKEEAKSSFTIKLVGFEASKKVAVVKEVRSITALGLKESKELVEQFPKVIKKAVPAEEAQALKAKLEAAGATVELE